MVALRVTECVSVRATVPSRRTAYRRLARSTMAAQSGTARRNPRGGSNDDRPASRSRQSTWQSRHRCFAREVWSPAEHLV
jgi:hypothetical protein